MGKLLVNLFLGGAAFAVLTFFVMLARALLAVTAYLYEVLRDGHLHPVNILDINGPFTTFWLAVAQIVFFLLVPLFLLVLLYPAVDKTNAAADRTPPPFNPEGKDVLVALTAYNEEQAVGMVVDEFLACPQVREVVVVDNNSTDRTAERARAHGATVVPERQQGYGHACIRGLTEGLARPWARMIVLCEGDGSYIGGDLGKLLPYLSEADMVIGNRTTHVLVQPGAFMDWFISWGNMFMGLLIRLRYWNAVFFGRVRLTDGGCTFRALRREALVPVLPTLKEGGPHFCSHMIMRVLDQNQTVVEVPIRFRRRLGQSKYSSSSRKKAFSVGIGMWAEIAWR
ncbi:MAG: glycosyltransferase family 2 protein [Euryarchaeota archaeon]|nr:glycosyltransferase family 2 protein [Euryarchaeota archaeon]MDE1836399.1 glycosyltransferase family 2 protein [Euryarchaeota archaeon]MDE1881678.1 glycosyltransferase family 2 protein [Euryarchaeota archaeon]MDE2044147.1 glycosyltransferase family 2 protein [Thermoplasmata archaeon]